MHQDSTLVRIWGALSDGNALELRPSAAKPPHYFSWRSAGLDECL